jgi:hypothetical protein
LILWVDSAEDVEASVKPRKKHHLTVSALAQDQKQSKTKIRTYAMRKAPEDLIGMYGNGHSGMSMKRMFDHGAKC